LSVKDAPEYNLTGFLTG